MARDLVLEVLLEGALVERLPLDGEIQIGRDPGNRIVLSNARISKIHARLFPRDKGFVIADSGSAGGLWCSGERVREREVAPGDEFTIGPYLLRIQAGETGVPASLQRPSPPALPHLPGRATGETANPFEDFELLVQGLIQITGIIGITDLQVVLETLLERIMKLLAARRGYVLLAEGEKLSSVIARQGATPMMSERFSRTVCTQATRTRESIILSGPEHLNQIECLQSLKEQPPRSVLAVPLIEGGAALGVLYLESDQFLPDTFQEKLKLLAEVSALGGRALRSALERQLIAGDKERWRWLATHSNDDPDLFRSCVSTRMAEVGELIQRISAEDVTAVILGESGTGKEVVARTIHRLSHRSEGPFVAVNCGAIPRELIEGELFGHEKGAFTGALKRKLGRFELAQGGTLLLDEIGDLPRDLQVKLLRVLETRTFERLGGEETVTWDARVLAATNKNLGEAVSRGEFREDLYYRLSVVTVDLPPLRERRSDIPALVGEILLTTNRKFRRKLYGVTPEALSALTAYDWPGNVRELRNVIERAFVIEPSDRLGAGSLPFKPAGPRPDPSGSSRGLRDEHRPIPPLAEFVRAQECEYIRLVLDQVGGNMTRAAEVTGLTRSAFYKKMKALGLRSSTPTDHMDDGGEGPG